MAANAPWSVKGIDPKAREIAKGLAHRSGMTLGEWLNQMILEDSDTPAADAPSAETAATTAAGDLEQMSEYRRFEAPEHPGDNFMGFTAALDRLTARIEAAENRTTQAISGIDESVTGALSRLEQAEREQIAVAARFEGAVADIAGEQNRISERMRRVEDESTGPRSVEAVRSMEAALAKVASHLYEGEARSEERFAALRGELDEMRSPLADPAGGPDAEALSQQIAERLGEAEARTSEAMADLRASLAKLDQRIGAAETGAAGRSPQAALEQLAVSLSARVDAARAEMAQKLRETADDRFERIERSLAEMSGHVDKAERHSADAIERMGREVLRMADSLGRRVQDVEHRSADAIEQVGGQVARMASSMDERLARTDEINAKALEKLGGEIARITERLSERISNAERRSAQAMDEMGEQVSRVSERLGDRHERTSSELSERIRLSEERTARLLEDARERLDQRLEQTQKKLEEARPAAPAFAAFEDPDVAPFGRDEYDSPTSYAAPANAAAFRHVDDADIDDDESLIASPLADAGGGMGGGGERAEHADAPMPVAVEPESPVAGATIRPETQEPHFEPAAEPEPHFATGVEPEPHFAPPVEPESPLGTSVEPEPRSFAVFDDDDLLEPADHDAEADGDAAHAEAPLLEPAIHPDAAVATGESEDAGLDEDMLAAAAMAGLNEEPAPETEAGHEDLDVPRPPLSTRELIEQTRAAARAANAAQAERRSPARRTFGARGKGPRSAMTTALLVSGGAAALSMALVGYEFALQRPAGQLPTRVAEALGFGAPSTPLAGERPAAGEGGGQPLAAIALDPTPIVAVGPNAQQSEAAAEFYADGKRRIEARDDSGVEALRHAANLGYGPAEFYLAKLYETGGAGVKKDPGQARTWTERAAEAGDVKAMHNLALDFFEGAGGPKDLSQAATWFHRAADQGLVDSQYNLARLYEEGFGVTRNPAEAYKWYLIAARSGDGPSGTAAQRLKDTLSPEAQSAAERSARAFAPDTAPPAGGTANAPPSVVATAQRGLSRLGYYQGPYDGVTSPALNLAVAAFQRDQGLPATGALDATVNQRLAAAAQ